jgi:sigma-E factor negative regulatory protein RseB
MRGSERVLALALGCLAAGSVLAEEPARWLERMNQALTTRNYDGTFSHWHGGQVEMLRIIHRVQDGTVSERLASLDGSGREFIRTGASLACYLPDKRTVVVEQRPQQESLVGFPAVNDQTASFYEIKEVARTRLNRRDTHVITVTPKDEYRYGYRLWIDDSTAMPLKTQLCDAHGNVIEQIVFAELNFRDRIAADAVKPAVSGEGFRWVRQDAQEPRMANVALGWSIVRVPSGFRLTTWRLQVIQGSNTPVRHLVLSDGLASVSVFIEPRSPQTEAMRGLAKVGAAFAFSRDLDGHQVTAVGEVPAATVEAIAEAVTKEEAAELGPVAREQRQ